MAYFNPKGHFTGVFLPTCLLQRTELTMTAKAVYAYLAFRYDEKKGVAFPGQDTMAAALGCSDRSIRNALTSLETLGLIETDQPGMKRTLRYRFKEHEWITSGQDRKKLPVIPENIATPGAENIATPIEQAQEENKHKSTSTRSKEDAIVLPDLPQCLQTPSFYTAWSEWETYRKEIKKPLTPASVAKQIKLLAAHPADAVEMIETAIRSGWQGIFPLKGKSNGKSKEGMLDTYQKTLSKMESGQKALEAN